MSHVYLSPCLQAMPGSMHGYDVTDPARISEDLGGEEAWSGFVGAARAQGLKILLDIVPNHMAAAEQNAWWDEVLTHGPFSEHADFFDIRKAAAQPFRINICSLAHAYGESLEKGEFEIESRGGRPRLKHFDNSWPLGPASWGVLLEADDRGRRRAYPWVFRGPRAAAMVHPNRQCGPRGVPSRRRRGGGLVSPMHTATGGSSRPSSARSAIRTPSTGSSSGNSSPCMAGSSRAS